MAPPSALSAAASNAPAPRSSREQRHAVSPPRSNRLAILRELQADGRITNVELARKVGISAPPCLRRVRALEEAGLIRGYAALLDDRALGYDVTAFAMVGLHSQAEADLIAFEERVRGSPIVRDCYAFGRDRLHAEMRGAGPHLPFQDSSSTTHRRAECRQRQDLSRHPRVEARSRRAHRDHAGDGRTTQIGERARP